MGSEDVIQLLENEIASNPRVVARLLLQLNECERCYELKNQTHYLLALSERAYFQSIRDATALAVCLSVNPSTYCITVINAKRQGLAAG